MVVDVKGDTDVEFVIPYCYPTDWIWRAFNNALHTIVVFPISEFISTDSATETSITMVAWTAAAEDVQFAFFDRATACTYGYPNVTLSSTKKQEFVMLGDRVQKQCHIISEFEKPFRPFLEGSNMMVDNNRCVSFQAGRVVDLIKKYQTYSLTVADSIANINCYIDGDTGTANWMVRRMFLFHRGGVKFKCTVTNAGGITGAMGPSFDMNATSSPLDGPFGQPFYAHIPSTDNEDSIAIPYLSPYPFLNILRNETFSAQLNISLVGGSILQTFLAARDDYELGFLIPPPVASGVRRSVGKPKPAKG